MRKGFGAGLSLLCGLAVFLFIPYAAEASDGGSPQIVISGATPLQNQDVVIATGKNFPPGVDLNNFGAVVRFKDNNPLKRNDQPTFRGFDLPLIAVRADAQGGFRIEIPLTILQGVNGRVELCQYYKGRVTHSNWLPVNDPGVLPLYTPPPTDATAGTLTFGDFAHGGPSESPAINGDDVPLTGSGWAGTLFQVDEDRYTTVDATSPPDPVQYSNLTNDVAFSGGDLTAASSAVLAGITPTYLSIRVTVLVWDPPNYGSIAHTTTTGATQGEGYLATADVTAPTLQSASATALTTVTVTFSEAVTTPADTASAIDNWTVTFNGNKAVSALTPLGSAGTTTITLTVADMGDLGATPTVDFTTGAAEFEDASGNDAATGNVVATDDIAPATPSLTAPTDNTKMEGASVSWSGSAGSGTDNSLAGLRFRGSDNGSSWTTLDTDVSSPYGGTYTFGTKYTYYRTQAYDTEANTANSSATSSLQDAHHLHFTTIPASTQAGVESGQWTFTVHDNYGNPENVTQTISLSTSSDQGSFRATPGGLPPITYVSLIGSSAGNFYYYDTKVNDPWIYVVNVALVDDSTQYSVTANTGIASVKIRTAAGGAGSETGALEIAGAANGGTYNVTEWMYVAGYNSLGSYVQDVAANWTVTGSLPTGGGSGFTNADPSSSNKYTAVTSSTSSGTIVATYSAMNDATGTVSVDVTRPATVTGFNITTDPDDSLYVNASWNPTSSYDDGSSAASGNVGDFQVRYSASIINSEGTWSAASQVNSSGKPTSFNGSNSWRIYMGNVFAGFYYFAIKTMDPQGYWSNMGSGCYTTTPDWSLPVTLSVFTAAGGYNRIFLAWSTESEVDVLGFQVWRDTEENFSNPVMIAGYDQYPELLCRGEATTGADYSYVDHENLQPEKAYYYRLGTVDINGRSEINPMTASASCKATPTEFALSPNFPNPFNPNTHFDVQLPTATTVTVTIFDLRGCEVAQIVDHAEMEAGVYRFSWNGSAANGATLPSGMYLCRLQTLQAQRIIKMMLLK